MGFGTTPRRCGIHSKPQSLLQKTCLFYTFETQATYTPIYACFGPYMQAAAHIRGKRATLVILFSKIDFCSFKSLYFYLNIPQVNLISDWALN